MQPAERKEFDKHLAVLFAALDKPATEARMEAFWKGLQRMSLVEFARCCELLLSELSDGEPRRQFTVGDVWGAKRRLRATAPKAPAEPPWPGSHSLRIVNLMFFRWMDREIRTRQRVGNRSIPDDELRARRSACLELAEAEETMRSEGQSSLKQLQASFDSAMARIAASSAAEAA